MFSERIPDRRARPVGAIERLGGSIRAHVGAALAPDMSIKCGLDREHCEFTSRMYANRRLVSSPGRIYLTSISTGLDGDPASPVLIGSRTHRLAFCARDLATPSIWRRTLPFVALWANHRSQNSCARSGARNRAGEGLCYEMSQAKQRSRSRQWRAGLRSSGPRRVRTGD